MSILNMTFEEWVAHPKPLLCLDFDGVIHYYSKGYHDGTIYDCPVPGAREFIRDASETFDIVIFSARAKDEKNILEMRQWLECNRLPPLEITNTKPPAFLTIDDRAITFPGYFPSDPKALLGFKPWNKINWKR